jgi:hypothetical protein
VAAEICEGEQHTLFSRTRPEEFKRMACLMMRWLVMADDVVSAASLLNSANFEGFVKHFQV